MLMVWTYCDQPLSLGGMALVLVLVLLLALWIDHLFGEPRTSLHPVVWIGLYLKIFGRKF